MANIILHNDGAYNVYSDVDEAVCYERALTRQQLNEALYMLFTDLEMEEEVPEMFVHAHKTGCSIKDMTLAQCIKNYRVGVEQKEIPLTDFIAKFLTLKSA